MNNYYTIRQLTTLPETSDHDPPPTYSAIRRAVQRGTIPSIKPGLEYFVKRIDYQLWLETFTGKTGPKKGN